MKLVVFGLSVSSSWGNGHAVLWRALIRALAAQGHRTVFFERDAPWYAEHRDVTEIDGGRLVLYDDWNEIRPAAARELRGAEAAIVTSYCPDGVAATEIVLDSPGLHVFYDLDTPVTLARIAAGERIEAIGPRGLAPFDLVLSYTGGGALTALRVRLGARRVAPLYGSVDPTRYRPGQPPPGPLAGIVLSRDLCRRPAGQAGHAAAGAGASPAAMAFPDRRRAISAGLRLVGQHLFLATRRASRPPELLRGGARDAERDPSIDGRERVVPFGQAVRGGGVRRPDPQRLVGGDRHVLHAGFATPDRPLYRGRARRARPHRRGAAAHRRGGPRAHLVRAHRRATRRRADRAVCPFEPSSAGLPPWPPGPRATARIVWRPDPCGASFPPPETAPAFSRWLSRRNCCRSAAASTRAPSARAPSANT